MLKSCLFRKLWTLALLAPNCAVLLKLHVPECLLLRWWVCITRTRGLNGHRISFLKLHQTVQHKANSTLIYCSQCRQTVFMFSSPIVLRICPNEWKKNPAQTWSAINNINEFINDSNSIMIHFSRWHNNKTSVERRARTHAGGYTVQYQL